jgi:hypothetical protein
MREVATFVFFEKRSQFEAKTAYLAHCGTRFERNTG